jgi:hypothetical protein
LQVYGGKITYDGLTETIVALGDEKGSDSYNAMISYQNPKQPVAPFPPYPRFIITRTKAGLDVKFGERPRTPGR